MKFKVWLDSGANIHSCYDQEITLQEIGVSEEDWQGMTEDEQEEVMRDIAWSRMDWGYREIED